jgi:hypothetical protein
MRTFLKSLALNAVYGIKTFEIVPWNSEVTKRCRLSWLTSSALVQYMSPNGGGVGCALTFASEAKFEIEAKISFRLEAKKA